MTPRYEIPRNSKGMSQDPVSAFTENLLCARKKKFMKHRSLSHFTGVETEAWGVSCTYRARGWVCLTPKNMLWCAGTWLLQLAHWIFSSRKKTSSVTAHFPVEELKTLAFLGK